MAKAPARGRIIQDNEMVVMDRIIGLLAMLKPTRRKAVYDWIGQRLDNDDLQVIAEVREPEPVPMFPDADTRARQRSA